MTYVPPSLSQIIRPEKKGPKGLNALRATGPRTPEGKAIASQNSLKHGLTARQVVIPGESQEDFDNLLASTAADRKPEGELEIQMRRNRRLHLASGPRPLEGIPNPR